MVQRDYIGKIKKTDAEQRTTENIRQDIAKGEDAISQTVEQLSERIIEKLDWRGYVRDYPYLAIGSAAGIGYLASGLFIKRITPMERIMGSIAEGVRDSLDGMLTQNSGTGIIRMTLLGIATRATVILINKCNLNRYSTP